MRVSRCLSYLFLLTPRSIHHLPEFIFRMASGTRGANRNDAHPPPPPEATLTQLLNLLMEDRQNSRTERAASIAALQQIAQNAANNNHNREDEPRSKLRDF